MEENIHRPTLQNYLPMASFKEGLRVIRHRILRNKLQEQGVLLKPSPNRTMVFAPHADDETLGCGGFIALKHDLKAQVEVVILTDGSACFGSLPPAAANALVERREREAERAVAMLGVPKNQLHFLRQPDGRLSSLVERDRNALLTQLIELLERYSPQEILVPHRLDNTPDHETTFALVHSALKATSLRPLVLQYPIWRFWSGPLLDARVPSTVDAEGVDAERLYRLEISQVLEKKRKAFSCYASQYSAVGEFSSKASLPARFQKAFELKYEVFFGLGDT
jgi:N-acetylglucosamine malate deacetylase 1